MANELQKFFNGHKLEFLKSNLDGQSIKYGTRRTLEHFTSNTLHKGEDIGDINRAVTRIVTRSKSKRHHHVSVSEDEGTSSIDSDHDSSSHGNSSRGNSSHDDSEQYSDDRLRQQESDDMYNEEEEEECFEQEEYEVPKARKRRRNATRGITF